MTERATGSFEVDLEPQPLTDEAASPLLGRLSINKRFMGDLEAISKGEMLSAGTTTQGSAGYVALEKVTGTLHGREGGFVLQHSGTMRRGEGDLSVTVVPDSGTGELMGLEGRMTIEVNKGEHWYGLEYSLKRDNGAGPSR